MAHTEDNDDCVSKKPWGEVLSRSLKLFTFGAAREGGKSFGRVIFYVILAAVILFAASYAIDSFTGWFSSWFDFWPFNRAAEVEPQQDTGGWFSWGGSDEAAPVATTDSDPKWYCNWNPIC